MTDHVTVALLAYPDAQQAALLGLSDLFALANRRADAHGASGLPRFAVNAWTPDSPRPAYLLVPPALGEPPTAQVAAPLVEPLRTLHRAGTVLVSVCAGAFLLAETGVLNGRRATTHWVYDAPFAARFPAVRLDTGRLLIDDGDVITAGGLMAWTDLGLTLVERHLGPALMREVARYLLVDPPGREQRTYAAFLPRFDHGDAAIVKAQHQLHRDPATPGPALATEAGLEDRTFLRRFRRATGLTPTAYRHALRLGQAQLLLETTRQTVDQIAWAIGYDDPGAFRRLFQAHLGLSPRAYRQKFAHPVQGQP